jgi:methyl-accepting chemotaxis protein
MTMRWTAGRRIAVITSVGLAAIAAVAVVGWRSAGAVEEGSRAAERQTNARSLYQFLDNRSSELKVSALKSLVDSDLAALQAEVAADTTTVGILIADLRALDLDADDVARVDAVEEAFADYTATIASYVDAAAEKRRADRPTARSIQAANDAMDAVLSEAVLTSGTDAHAASVDLNHTAEQMRTTVLVVAALGLALLAGLALAVGRTPGPQDDED